MGRFPRWRGVVTRPSQARNRPWPGGQEVQSAWSPTSAVVSNVFPDRLLPPPSTLGPDLTRELRGRRLFSLLDKCLRGRCIKGPPSHRIDGARERLISKFALHQEGRVDRFIFALRSETRMTMTMTMNTLREVQHLSDEGLALQARVVGVMTPRKRICCAVETCSLARCALPYC